MIRWGVLSTAKIGVKQAIPALWAAPDCKVTTIASRDLNKAMDVAKQFEIPIAADSYDAVLQSSDVDAVYIPLPSSHHVEWTQKAAVAGKHVLCEKPIALEAAEITRLIEERDAQNVMVSEAMMAVYHPQWRKVRDLIEDGAIGALRHVTASFAYHNTDPNNIRNKLETGGGALPDIGCYPIATTRFATGADATRVVAQIQRDRSFGTDINVAALIDFGDFDLLMQVATQLAWRQSSTFHGENGYIQVAAPFNAMPKSADVVRLFRDAREAPEEFRFDGINQYRMQFEAFSQAVRTNDGSTILSLEESRQNQSIIDSIYASARTGSWQDII
ncbi:MAG: Gfo/Idh/MocA family oxidoreductase [Pseudomonadota bacterium]